MPDESDRNDPQVSDSRDELRTIAFRLREIQRLLGMRVTQENVRLEAEELSPVTEAKFFKETDHEPQISHRQVRHNVGSLGDLDLGDTVQLTLLNGRSVSGRIGPLDYIPGEQLRLELEPVDGAPIRYEVKTHMEDVGWSPITVRRYQQGDDEWVSLGVIRSVRKL